jgi:hypothetical protein
MQNEQFRLSKQRNMSPNMLSPAFSYFNAYLGRTYFPLNILESSINTFSNAAYSMYSPSSSTCTGTNSTTHGGHLRLEEMGLEDIIPLRHSLLSP